MHERDFSLRVLIVLLAAAVALHLAGLLWQLAMDFYDVIVLFILAWLFAFVLRPMAKGLHHRSRLPWVLCVATVYLLVFAAILGLGFFTVPVLAAQLTQMAVALPKWIQGLSVWWAATREYIAAELAAQQLSVAYTEPDLTEQLQQIAAGLLQNMLSLLTGIATGLFGLVVVFVLSFYITLDGERISAGALRLVPDEHKDEARFLLESIDRSFGGFLRGQLFESLVYATGTAVFMAIAGLEYIALAATIAGIAMFIPFVGPFIAMAPTLIIAAIQGSLSLVLAMFVALLLLQQFVFHVMSPRIMSHVVGLHPLLVLGAILVGGKVAGVVGVILGIPVVAVISAMLVFFYGRAQRQRERAATRLIREGASALPNEGQPGLEPQH